MALHERNHDKGFTLVELLVVIIIIGILVAVAVPVFLNQRQKAFDAHTKSDIKSVVFAQEEYIIQHPNEAGSFNAAAFVNVKKGSHTVYGTWLKGGGYCVVGFNTGGSISGPVNQKYIWYDSLAGGLSFTDGINAPLKPGACTDPRPGVMSQYWEYETP